MSWIDIGIFVIYMLTMLGVGFYFMKRNANHEDYYVGEEEEVLVRGLLDFLLWLRMSVVDFP